MGTMQLTRGIGATISIEGRSYTKTNSASVVLVPARKTSSGATWHYWAVIGRSKSDVSGSVSTPQYTAEYNLVVNGRNLYILTLDNGAFADGVLTISGPGVTSASIQTSVAEQWYDLASMTGNNPALIEADFLLSSVKTTGIAPRLPGGGKLVKVVIGQYSLAAQQNIDIKAKLPDLYQKLSVDNFYAEPTTSNLVENYNNSRYEQRASFWKTYDPQTGILAIPSMYHNPTSRLAGGLEGVTIYAVYVK